MEMREIIKGGYHTVLDVHLLSGEALEEHYATSDAIVIVLEGSGKLVFDEEQVYLKKESAYLIPGLKRHVLEAIDDLKAYIVLDTIGNIQMSETKVGN